MARYLSQAWFDAMEVAAANHTPERSSSGVVSLRETVMGTPFGDITYMMCIDNGVVRIVHDKAEVADVTFTQDYATASALHRGELTTQDAFFAGKVKVAGHLNTLLEHADALQGIAPAFEQVRKETTYD